MRARMCSALALVSRFSGSVELWGGCVGSRRCPPPTLAGLPGAPRITPTADRMLQGARPGSRRKCPGEGGCLQRPQAATCPASHPVRHPGSTLDTGRFPPNVLSLRSWGLSICWSGSPSEQTRNGFYSSGHTWRLEDIPHTFTTFYLVTPSSANSE